MIIDSWLALQLLITRNTQVVIHASTHTNVLASSPDDRRRCTDFPYYATHKNKDEVEEGGGKGDGRWMWQIDEEHKSEQQQAVH